MVSFQKLFKVSQNGALVTIALFFLLTLYNRSRVAKLQLLLGLAYSAW